MPEPPPEPPPGPSRLETFGAWLGLWTPPRGVTVAPPPWGRIALTLVALALVAGIPFALVSRDAAENRRTADRAESRERAQALASRLRQLRVEARPRRARVPPRATIGTPGARRAARAALVVELEDRLAEDAARRARAGELSGSVVRAECEPFPRSASGARPEAELRRSSAAYACLAVTAEFAPGTVSSGGQIGYPFRAVVDFGQGRLTWCRVSGRPAEGSLQRENVVVLPSACAR